MSLDADYVVERRRLKRRLTFWRVLGVVAVVAAVVAAAGRFDLRRHQDHVAKIVIGGLILDDPDRDDALKEVADDSKAKALRDLKGKTFAFGSPASTSGHLMPRFFLLKAGINPDKDFSRLAFSGAHDATVAFVASGRAEAGALNASVYDKLIERGDANAKAVRILQTTPPYYDYNWTVRGGLDPALVTKLTAAFLDLDPKNPAHKEILDLQRATRFIATKPENYKGIEEAARSAGLLK